jgi:3alpha(or 20beta)-hydroxysteroid dehydrogenase
MGSVDYPKGKRLAGRVAIVTGAARGMGASFARAMVAQGAKVVLGDVLDEAGLALEAELGASAAYAHLDVTEREHWRHSVDRAVDQFGKLNVLVNNAGILAPGVVGEISQLDWARTIDVNLTGAFNGIQAALPALRGAAPASIINISSIAGIKGYPALAAYTASKFGLRGLTKSVALDLAEAGIRCNSVHPGAVVTPMTAGMDMSQQHVAMKRAGHPHELAHVVVFLASEESSYCTGAEFVADGGETAGLASVSVTSTIRSPIRE